MDGLSINIFLNKWKNFFYLYNIDHSSYSKIHLEKLFSSRCTVYKYNLFKYFFDKQLVRFFNNSLLLDKINSLSIPIDSNRLVFIDGCFVPDFSDIEFIVYNNIASCDVFNYLPDIFSNFYLHLIESSIYKTFVCNINSKKFNDKPIYLLNISTGLSDSINVLNYRYHIVVESMSHVDLIEHYVSLNDYPHLTCARFIIEVLNGSFLNHTKILLENSSSYHFSYSDIYIDKNSYVNSVLFFLGSNIVNSHTNARLSGVQGNISLNSLSLPSKDNLYNNYTYVEHNVSNSKSYQLHKIISAAYGKFKGLIKISKCSPKVEAEMSSKNLLLNSASSIDIDPKLEIYSNDVKCTHSATIGRIDKDQIFYLCSRGIGSKMVYNMIISAFSYDIVNLIQNKLLKEIIYLCVDKCYSGDCYEFLNS